MDIFAQPCDLLTGSVVMIACKTHEDAWALGATVPDDLRNDIAWIFINGVVADNPT